MTHKRSMKMVIIDADKGSVIASVGERGTRGGVELRIRILAGVLL